MTAFGEVQDYVERLTAPAHRRAARRHLGDRRLHRLRPRQRRGPGPDPGQADDRGRPAPLRPHRLAPRGRHVPQLRLRRRLLGGRRRHEDLLPRRAAELRLLPRGQGRPRPRGHGRQRAVADRRHRLLLRAVREDHERDLRALVGDHARARDGLLVQPRVPAGRRPRRAAPADSRSSCGTTGWSAAGAAATARTARTATAPVFGVGLAVQPLEGQERLSPVVTTGHEIVHRLRRPGQVPRRLRRREGRHADRGRAHRDVLLLRPRALDHLGHRGRPAVDPARRLAQPRAPSDERFLGAVFSNVPVEPGRHVHAPVGRRRRLRRSARARPRARCCEDVVDGYVSVERARKDYGVVVQRDRRRARRSTRSTPAATERERARIRAERARLAGGGRRRRSPRATATASSTCSTSCAATA